MKYIVIIFLSVLSVSVFAQNAELVFVDGWVDIKSAGDTFEAFPGDSLKAGDSVVTGEDSYAELEQKDLSSITVKPESIFTIREIETDSGRKTVLATTVGSVSFKFGKLLGAEPRIATPSMVAGIRGTELTVYAGEDGSTLIAVTSGLVSVESEGSTVDLKKDEGVEVRPGEAPGEKFSLLGREMDFASWNKEKYESLIADPLSGLIRFNKQLNNYVADIKSLEENRTSNAQKKIDFQSELEKLKKSNKQDEADKFFKKNIQPLILLEAPMYLNIRYYILSALSFRRYIMGKLYLEMKSKYIMDAGNAVYKEFLSNYNRILDSFEIHIVPYMNPRDL